MMTLNLSAEAHEENECLLIISLMPNVIFLWNLQKALTRLNRGVEEEEEVETIFNNTQTVN